MSEVNVEEVERWRIVIIDEETTIYAKDDADLKEQIKELARKKGFTTVKMNIDWDTSTIYVMPVEKPA